MRRGKTIPRPVAVSSASRAIRLFVTFEMGIWGGRVNKHYVTLISLTEKSIECFVYIPFLPNYARYRRKINISIRNIIFLLNLST